MRDLSSEELRWTANRLETEGYAVVSQVVSKGGLQRLDQQLNAAYNAFPMFEGGGAISGHINCFPGEEGQFVYDELEASGLADMIRDMRPGLHNRVRATLNFNLPGSIAQHYHMDGVFLSAFIICNIAVVDTGITNGAIDVLPGTHARFYPFWQYALRRTYRRTTRVPMEQGDVLIRRSTLWHRGMPNRSNRPRPMMSLTFGEESAPQGGPFAADAGIVFYPNWYSNGRLGILRERMEVAAPITRSTYRFMRSLVGNRGYASY
jgi:hypothetical protein